jgi:uncharacterized protein
MSHDRVIDSVAFARAGSECHGTLEGARLTRLADNLVDRQGELSYRVCGGVWGGKPGLGLEIEGWLLVRCLRCLGTMRWPVRINNRVQLARDEADLDRADDEGIDAILGSETLDLVELVEDEVLLQWPIAPRHDVHQLQECNAAGGSEGDLRNSPGHPFAALGKLSRRDGGADEGIQDKEV